MSIEQPAYAAKCEEGRCVPVTDFCAPMTATAPAVTLEASLTPGDVWEQYRGQVIQVRGAPRFGLDTCECCTACDCDCFDNPVQQTLECAVSLRGSLCGLEYSCSGTECNADCSPRELQNYSTFTGYLVDSASDGMELWITSNDNDCPPEGLNPEGAPCTPMGDDDCMEGLHCFFWGDVLDNCIGECRPMGTECMFDTDCDEGDLCFMGYCMWCCPG
jgi:hypothetical protein